MNMKSMLCVATSALSAMLMASDTPEVSNVQMSQSSTGRKVTVTYQLSNAANGAVVTLDIETNKTGSATNNDSDWVSIGGAAVCNARGAVWRKVTSADADGNGQYTITWRPDQSWEGHKVELADGGARAVVTAWALDNTPDYMVVDVSRGAARETQKYYPSAAFVPGGVLGNTDYRMSKLLMRKINAKDVEWTMGALSQHVPSYWLAADATRPAKLDGNYYIGVFPVTQGQWFQIAPNSSATPCYATNGAMRPMEQVSYNEIRASAAYDTADASHDWPHDPADASFLGLLRDKTGLDFDLPSEAQWEYAARAGNGSGYWGDGTTALTIDTNTRDAHLDAFGRYQYNGGKTGENGTGSPASSCGPENATAIAGSYRPNAWGLYDTAGNVWEWCLDFYAASADVAGLNGAVNTTKADNRVLRGGAWSVNAPSCSPARRSGYGSASRYANCGLRLVCTAGLE